MSEIDQIDFELAEALSEVTQAGLWGLDTHERKVWLSRAARHALEIQASSCTLDDFVEIFPEKERAGCRRAFELHIQSAIPLMVSMDCDDHRVEIRGVSLDRVTTATHEKPLVFGSVRLIKKEGDADMIDQARARQAALLDSARIASIGAMTSGIAHEISNPLSILIGRAELLLKNFDQIDDREKIRSDIGKLLTHANRIATIVEDMRSLARSSSPRPKETALFLDLVTDALQLTEAKIKKSNTTVDFDRIDRSLKIDCRPPQIVQVLVNLINNSVEAISQNQSRWIKLDAVVTAAGTDLLFTDSGPPISDEVAEKIVRPFFTTKSTQGGTGLGLAICHAVMHAHQGALLVDTSATNASFVLRFPPALKKPNQ